MKTRFDEWRLQFTLCCHLEIANQILKLFEVYNNNTI